MVDVLVGKRRHEKVTVVVVWLHPHIDPRLQPRLFCCLDKLLGQELLLLVKVVAGALMSC